MLQSLQNSLTKNRKAGVFELAFWFSIIQSFWQDDMISKYPEYTEDIKNSTIAIKVQDEKINFYIKSVNIHFLTWLKIQKETLEKSISECILNQDKHFNLQLNIRCYLK